MVYLNKIDVLVSVKVASRMFSLRGELSSSWRAVYKEKVGAVEIAPFGFSLIHPMNESLKGK